MSKQVNVFITHEKILALKKQTEFWTICMGSNEFDYFPTIKGFLEEEEVEMAEAFIEEIISHLKK